MKGGLLTHLLHLRCCLLMQAALLAAWQHVEPAWLQFARRVRLTSSRMVVGVGPSGHVVENLRRSWCSNRKSNCQDKSDLGHSLISFSSIVFASALNLVAPNLPAPTKQKNPRK
jgi:hypothetical protein